MIAGRPTHFEIYGHAPGALAAFYGELFGWRVERADGVDYWRIHPDPAAPGSVVGGLTYRPSCSQSGWMHYVSVASLDEAVILAECLGARLLRPKTAIPRTAWYAVLADPEGNAFAIWQSDPTAFPPPAPE